MKVEIIVNKTERLDKLIARNTELSRNKISEIISNSQCSVDGKIQIKKSAIIELNSRIEVDLSESKKSVNKINLYYHFIDNDILIVEKPKNLITHQNKDDNVESLNSIILNDYPEINSVGDIERPGIVHRLDKDTTGLIIVARTQNAYEPLKEMIKERKIDRNYTALVHGIPSINEAIIDAPISRDPKNPIKRKVIRGGKKSKTFYKIKRTFDQFSLLDVKLFSGRTHQIRVHLENIGHPVVGDNLYTNKNSNLNRPFLHSSKLEFFHPLNNESLKFESKIPKDLEDFIKEIK